MNKQGGRGIGATALEAVGDLAGAAVPVTLVCAVVFAPQEFRGLHLNVNFVSMCVVKNLEGCGLIILSD